MLFINEVITLKQGPRDLALNILHIFRSQPRPQFQKYPSLNHHRKHTNRYFKDNDDVEKQKRNSFENCDNGKRRAEGKDSTETKC